MDALLDAITAAVAWSGVPSQTLRPLAAEAELIATLRERGFEVTRDDGLISTLDGRIFDPVD